MVPILTVPCEQQMHIVLCKEAVNILERISKLSPSQGGLAPCVQQGERINQVEVVSHAQVYFENFNVFFKADNFSNTCDQVTFLRSR